MSGSRALFSLKTILFKILAMYRFCFTGYFVQWNFNC